MKHCNNNILHVVNIYFVLPYFIGGQFKYFKEKGYRFHVVCSASEYLEAYAKDNDFDPSSKVVIDAVVDLILTPYDILIYIKNTEVEEEHCKEIVTEVMRNIMNSWKQVVTNVDNKLIIKTLIEKMIMKGHCSRSMIHMSIE